MKMKHFEIPPMYEGVDYQTDVPERVKRIVENLKDTRKGLFLHGKPGTGKTHIAYAICKKLEEDGVGVRVFKAYEILNMIREDMFSKYEDFNNGERFFKDAESFLKGINDFGGLVFIDDLGVEKTTDWSYQALYEIIDKKYENKIPMILTCNFNLGQLGEKMDERISSRIAGMCNVIELSPGDRRITPVQNG